MSVGKEILDTLRGIVLMSEKVERLLRITERLEQDHAHLRERVVRLETWFELIRQAANRRTLPPG